LEDVQSRNGSVSARLATVRGSCVSSAGSCYPDGRWYTGPCLLAS
jgi:hypothetical protein